MQLSTSHFAAVVALTACIEVLTVLFRFVFRLDAAKHTAFLARFTLGFRIHHGYLGLVLLPIALVQTGPLSAIGCVVGLSLFLSDAIHHFAVLWPLTGSPQFDLRYRKPPRDI